MKKILLVLSSCVLLTGSNSYDSAERSWAEAQLGYALSIVEACPEFTLNPDGFGFPLEDLMKGSIILQELIYQLHQFSERSTGSTQNIILH